MMFPLLCLDAEPKYLIAVQPIPTNDVKKHCTGDDPEGLNIKERLT